MKTSSIIPSLRPGLRLTILCLAVVHPPWACATPTGAVDLNFDPGRGADDIVRALVLESNGSMMLGGSFRSFDGQPCSGLVRLGADGRLDTSFVPSSDGLCNAIARQTNGSVVVGGHFTRFGGSARRHLARFTAAGELDADFAPQLGAEDAVWALAIQSDGRILVGGQISEMAGSPAHGILRLLPGGAQDPEFDPGDGTDAGVSVVAILPDGGVLAGGSFESFGGVRRVGLVRLLPNGVVDELFEAALTGSFVRVESLLVQADGGVVVGGSFATAQGLERRGIVRLDANGQADPQFAAGGGAGEAFDLVQAIAEGPDGRLWIAGSFQRMNGCTVHNFAPVGTDGVPDPTFHPCGGVSGGVGRLAIQPDGQVLVAGDFGEVNHLTRSGIARLIGAATPPEQGVALRARIADGAVLVHFNTNPSMRYTIEASGDLADWGAWVSGRFDARSVDLTLPRNHFGDIQFFRALAVP